MNILKSHYRSKRFSHGYLFYGDRDSALKEMEELARFLLETSNIAANPDFCRLSFKKFGIKEAQELKDKAHRKPFGFKKIFLLEIGKISGEAENAMLKVLEEPPEGTYFLIFVPSLESVISTLKSRLVPIYVRTAQSRRLGGAVEFLRMDGQEKANFLERLKNTKERIEIKNLFLELIGALENDLKSAKDFKELQEAAFRIERLEKGINLLDKNVPLALVVNGGMIK
jgi:DNA polymerase III delta prime subunit